MSKDLATHLAAMTHGDEAQFSNDKGKTVKVQYQSEPALGDNNQPAPGYTVGYYHVSPENSEELPTSYRHSPHGPGLMGAKPYAAGQAAQRITAIFRDRR